MLQRWGPQWGKTEDTGCETKSGSSAGCGSTGAGGWGLTCLLALSAYKFKQLCDRVLIMCPLCSQDQGYLHSW